MLTIIAIGQTLRGDDGAGQAAVRLWMEAYPENARDPRVRVEISELPGLGLLDLLEGSQVAILVDAVQSGVPPGTLHILSQDDLSAFEAGSDSAHGWGVAETIRLGRQLDPDALPEEIILLGIEAGSIEPGEGLSPAVRTTLPLAAAEIERQVRSRLG